MKKNKLLEKYFFLNGFYKILLLLLFMFFPIENSYATGRVDINSGLTISPSTVTIGQNFSVHFNLKEFQGGYKTFEYIQLWIQDGNGNDVYDAQTWNNVSFSPNQQRNFSATTFLDPDRGRGPGSYRAIVRGKVAGDTPFNFGVVSGSGGVNPRGFTAVNPAGRVDVNGGVTASPSTVIVGQNFSISFSLKEFQGGSKTFEYVQLWIQNGSGGDIYEAKTWNNVSFSPNQQRNFSATTFLDPDRGRGPGSYRAIVRGKVAGDTPFNFGVVSGSGAVNPKSFTAVNPPGRVDINSGLTISPSTVTIGQNFSIHFNLKEFQGGYKTFENIQLWIQDGNGNDVYDAKTWYNVSFSPNQRRYFSATTFLDPDRGRGPGPYRAIVRGKVAGDTPFNFGVVSGSGSVNPKNFTAGAQEEGHVSISGGVSVSPLPWIGDPTPSIILGRDFKISFTLKETRGQSKTFDNIAIVILDSINNHIFDFYVYGRKKISGFGTLSLSAHNKIYPKRSPGTYKAKIRGKYNGKWFDFDTIGIGNNPRQFEVVKGSPIIITVDGLSFKNTVEFLPGWENTEHYLKKAITDMFREEKKFPIKASNIQSLDWSRDSNLTHQAVSTLRVLLRSYYKFSQDEKVKFIVISHSWGTVISYLALSLENTIKPDLFITLGSPLGSGKTSCFPIADSENMIQIYVNGWLDYYQDAFGLSVPNVKRWVNYWAWGDIISGPIRGYNSAVVNKQVGLLSNNVLHRNTITTRRWHKYDSLQPDGKENNNNLKRKVKHEVLKAMGKRYLPEHINKLLLIGHSRN